MTGPAERLKITRSRLTYAVTRLEKDGLLRREGCPSDRWGSIAFLTPCRASRPGNGPEATRI